MLFRRLSIHQKFQNFYIVVPAQVGDGDLD